MNKQIVITTTISIEAAILEDASIEEEDEDDIMEEEETIIMEEEEIIIAEEIHTQEGMHLASLATVVKKVGDFVAHCPDLKLKLQETQEADNTETQEADEVMMHEVVFLNGKNDKEV